MAQAEYDRLAQGLPHDEYLAQVGAYQACRRMVDLVDTLIAKAEALDERIDTADRERRDHSKRVTYATPHWKP